MRVFQSMKNELKIYEVKQAWLRPYKAMCIVESGSCDFTTVCGSEYMNLNTYILFSQECKNKPL